MPHYGSSRAVRIQQVALAMENPAKCIIRLNAERQKRYSRPRETETKYTFKEFFYLMELVTVGKSGILQIHFDLEVKRQTVSIFGE